MKNKITLAEGPYGAVKLLSHDDRLLVCFETQDETAYQVWKHRQEEISRADNGNRLTHPTFVKYFEFTDTESFSGPFEYKTHLLTVDYMTGGTLEGIMCQVRAMRKPNNWNDTQKFIVLYGFAHGMQALHDHGMFHYNVRTDNILLDHNLEPKINLFGLNREYPYDGRMTYDPEQWIYMPNDIYRHPSQKKEIYTQKSDVFSFGLVLYEVMSGTKIDENFYVGYQRRVPNLGKVLLRDLITRCWSNVSENRPTFAEIAQTIRDLAFNVIKDPNQLAKFQSYVRKIETNQVSDDLDGTLDNLEITASGNVMEAQTHISFLLLKGFGFDKDVRMAKDWAATATENGSTVFSIDYGYSSSDSEDDAALEAAIAEQNMQNGNASNSEDEEE